MVRKKLEKVPMLQLCYKIKKNIDIPKKIDYDRMRSRELWNETKFHNSKKGWGA